MNFIEIMDFCGYDLTEANILVDEYVRRMKDVDLRKSESSRKKCGGLLSARCVGCSWC